MEVHAESAEQDAGARRPRDRGDVHRRPLLGRLDHDVLAGGGLLEHRAAFGLGGRPGARHGGSRDQGEQYGSHAYTLAHAPWPVNLSERRSRTVAVFPPCLGAPRDTASASPAALTPLLGGGMVGLPKTKDISVDGLCLDTAAWYPLGTRLSIALIDPWSGSALEVIGDVVREATKKTWTLGILRDRAAARVARARRQRPSTMPAPLRETAGQASPRARDRRRAAPARRDGALRHERLGRPVRERRVERPRGAQRHLARRGDRRARPRPIRGSSTIMHSVREARAADRASHRAGGPEAEQRPTSCIASSIAMPGSRRSSMRSRRRSREVGGTTRPCSRPARIPPGR